MNKCQYLNTSNQYQQQLCRLAERGFRFVTECTAEQCEPGYEGFTEEDAAQDRAATLESETGFAHGVIKIEVDEDGNFWTDYNHI